MMKRTLRVWVVRSFLVEIPGLQILKIFLFKSSSSKVQIFQIQRKRMTRKAFQIRGDPLSLIKIKRIQKNCSKIKL